MEMLSASLLTLPAFVVGGLALSHLCALVERARGTSAPAPTQARAPWPWHLGRGDYETFRLRLAAKVGQGQLRRDRTCAGPLRSAAQDRTRRG